MSSLSYSTIAEHLRTDVPGFGPVYAEHVRDNDGILPHVLMGDLTRFVVEEARARGSKSVAVARALQLLERALASPDPDLQELVVVSFLENLDPDEDAFPVVRGFFGPELEKEYANLTR